MIDRGLDPATGRHPSGPGDSHGHPAAHQFASESHMSYYFSECLHLATFLSLTCM